MKIYTEVNWEWSEKENKLIEVSSVSEEHNGHCDLCGGGDGPTNNLPTGDEIAKYYENVGFTDTLNQLQTQQQGLINPWSAQNQQQYGLMKQQSNEQIALQNLLSNRQMAATGGMSSGIQQAAQRATQTDMMRNLSNQFQGGLQQNRMHGIGLLGDISGLQSGYAETLAGADIQHAQMDADIAMAEDANSTNFWSSMGQTAATVATKVYFMCIPEGGKIDTPGGEKEIETLNVGDKVIGYNGEITTIEQKHEYKENPDAKRFIKLTMDDDSVIDICDMHRIKGFHAKEYKKGSLIHDKVIKSIRYYGGVEKSYDLLTTDAGYRMSGIPVDSMIAEMAYVATKLGEAV